jgi:hypothetical protein
MKMRSKAEVLKAVRKPTCRGGYRHENGKAKARKSSCRGRARQEGWS